MHLAGDQPGNGLREGFGSGVTELPEPSCTSTSLLVAVVYGSGRCSPDTAALTWPSSTSSTPRPSGSPRSTNPSPASSPTTGPTRRTSVTSALPISGSVSSSSPTVLFRTPLASDSSRGGESLEQVKARRGTIALSHQIIDLALHGPHGSPMQNDESETLWFLIEDVFTAGDATPEPSPDGNTSSDDPPRPPRS